MGSFCKNADKINFGKYTRKLIDNIFRNENKFNKFDSYGKLNLRIGQSKTLNSNCIMNKIIYDSGKQVVSFFSQQCNLHVVYLNGRIKEI